MARPKKWTDAASSADIKKFDLSSLTGEDCKNLKERLLSKWPDLFDDASIDATFAKLHPLARDLLTFQLALLEKLKIVEVAENAEMAVAKAEKMMADLDELEEKTGVLTPSLQDGVKEIKDHYTTVLEKERSLREDFVAMQRLSDASVRPTLKRGWHTLEEAMHSPHEEVRTAATEFYEVLASFVAEKREISGRAH